MTKEQNTQELLAALRLDEYIRGLDVEAAVEDKRTAVQRRIAAAKAKVDGRTAEGAKRRKENARKKKRREYRRDVGIPRENVRALERIENEGWWPAASRRMCKHKDVVEITEDEWLQWVEPSIGGEWIRLYRYDTKQAWSLCNVLVVDEESGQALFDGKEHKLISLGYALSQDEELPNELEENVF